MTSILQTTKTENQVKESELYISCFISEHNLAFNSATHLVKVIRKICPDSKIATMINCGKTKAEAHIKNVIGKNERDKVINH